ncbi:DUF930 domain-containing protein [Phyllobacterium sp. YR531]|uniref:DUF930 domain-containing protein n=1 Tax=Phyllobacterium sp. YR531 TaxID=1144343 RepID=UPI0012F697F2|nr:DUF930 domain-containing protein [Phyllobacterium sp. YR531]
MIAYLPVMFEYATKPWKRLKLGVPVSLALHISIGLLLWTGLSIEKTPAPKENIEVKLVPPPAAPPKAAEKSQPTPTPAPTPLPAGGAPSFSAATAKAEQKTKETELPPVIAPEESKPDTADEKPKPEQATEAQKPKEPEKPISPDGMKPAPEEKTRPEAKAEQSAESAETKPTEKPSNLAPAKQLFSEESLSSFRVRQSARKMSASDRIKQLCTIEALEQVRRQRPGSFPDLLVPYSRSGERLSDYALNASGGAFRSRGDWYNINFKCTVDNSRSKVVSFSFAVGDAVPKSEWSGRGLLID